MWQSRRVASWFLVAAAATALEGVLLIVLVEILSLPKPAASLVAAEMLILAKFVLADRWVFDHPRPAWDRLLRYQGASVGALVVSWLVFNLLVLMANVPYQVAFVMGSGASFAWSLLTNFLWVWAKPVRNVNAGEHTGR